MINSVDYERQHLPKRHPDDAYLTYGFCFVFAWINFSVNVIAGVIFWVTSKKRKGVRARSMKEARENEPVILGRI